MKVCVLQPDYSTSDVDYKNYDPARDLTHLMPGAEFEHVLLNKLTIYKQLKELKKKISTSLLTSAKDTLNGVFLRLMLFISWSYLIFHSPAPPHCFTILQKT